MGQSGIEGGAQFVTGIPVSNELTNLQDAFVLQETSGQPQYKEKISIEGIGLHHVVIADAGETFPRDNSRRKYIHYYIGEDRNAVVLARSESELLLTDNVRANLIRIEKNSGVVSLGQQSFGFIGPDDELTGFVRDLLRAIPLGEDHYAIADALPRAVSR